MRHIGIGRMAAALGVAALFIVRPAAALEQFSYCGSIEVTGPPRGGIVNLIPVSQRRMVIGMYVGPTGIVPEKPASCAYVKLGKPAGGVYHPRIVVWSDVPGARPYHADIYSDPKGIWGHRQKEPSDASPAGLMARNREMEAYLDNAAGTPVLAAALKAIARGRKTTRFKRTLKAALPFAGGMTVTVPTRYRLHDFTADKPFPPRIERLFRKGERRRKPHSPDWRPITVRAALVPR